MGTDRAALAESHAHRVVQWVLRAGLVASVTAMLAGVVVRVATGHDDAGPAAPVELVGHALDPGLRLTLLGVMLLAVTPAARVVSLAVVWATARDWRFAGVAVVVALVLVAAVLAGSG